MPVLLHSSQGQSLAELRKANITGITKNDINSLEPHVGLSLDQIIVRAMGGIEGKNVITFYKASIDNNINSRHPYEP